MSNFRFDLATNLAILTTFLVARHLCNLANPELALNGGYVFIVLTATAMVFDAALTFLVFADAPSRYGKFCSPAEFVQRASGAAVCAIAMFVARFARMRRAKNLPSDALVIRTSAYTESHLPM